MNQNAETMQNNVIDLRELFLILKKRRKLIGITTVVITLLTIFYAFFIAKPVYEAMAVVEIAQIKKEPVQNLTDLKQRIEVLFNVNSKTKTTVLPTVSKLSIPKDSKKLMIIKTQGYNNDTAKQKIEEVIDYITSSQDKELISYKNIQQNRLALTEENIIQNQQLIDKIKKNINNYENKLFNISIQDAALAGIYTIEIGKKQTELNDAISKVYSLENTKNDLQVSISPLKIQKTTVIGEIETRDNPIKPKKKLLVIVSFITSLMLSIFLAFFLEFLRGIKNEEKDN